MICVFDYHFIFPEQENVYSKYVKEKTIAFYPIGESPLYVVELNWWIKKVKGTTAISEEENSSLEAKSAESVNTDVEV